MTNKKQWFEDLVSPTTPKHLKQWARHGLPTQAKHTITEKGVEIFSVSKTFKIVRK